MTTIPKRNSSQLTLDSRLGTSSRDSPERTDHEIPKELVPTPRSLGHVLGEIRDLGRFGLALEGALVSRRRRVPERRRCAQTGGGASGRRGRQSERRPGGGGRREEGGARRSVRKGRHFFMVLFALSPERPSERRERRGAVPRAGFRWCGFPIGQGVYQSIGKLSPPIREHENGAEVFLLDRALFHTFPPVRTERVASGNHSFLNTSLLIGRIQPRLLPHGSTLATSPQK
jgi:hypothetical protein